MFAIALSLILAAAPTDQPPETRYTGICVNTPANNQLAMANVYASYDGAKVWVINKDSLRPIDPGKLMQSRNKPFSINNEKVVLNGVTYAKYGLPRILSATDLEPKAFALKDGAPFYLEKGNASAEVVYALYNPVGCEFQPYQKVS